MLDTIRTIILAAFAIAGLGACAGEQSAQLPPEGVVRLSDQFTGEFDLIDKTGAPVTQEDFAGKIMLVYFGFTHCPDVCPGDVGVMSAALNALGDEASDVAPLFISVDPERDTPKVLSDYFAFDERIIPVTGSLEATEAARAAFKMYAQTTPLPDSALEYTVDHGRFFYISDRKGQPQYALTGGASPEDLVKVLQRSIAEF